MKTQIRQKLLKRPVGLHMHGHPDWSNTEGPACLHMEILIGTILKDLFVYTWRH